MDVFVVSCSSTSDAINPVVCGLVEKHSCRRSPVSTLELTYRRLYVGACNQNVDVISSRCVCCPQRGSFIAWQLTLTPNSHRSPYTRQCCLCRVRRCELIRPDRLTEPGAFRVGVRPAVAPPSDTLWRWTHLSGGRADSVHTATADTTRRSCRCCVWCAGVNGTIALNVFRLQIFCWRHSWVVRNLIHTAEADAKHTRQFCRVWRGGVN